MYNVSVALASFLFLKMTHSHLRAFALAVLFSRNILLPHFPITAPVLSLVPLFKGRLHTAPLPLLYYYLEFACLSLY